MQSIGLRIDDGVGGTTEALLLDVADPSWVAVLGHGLGSHLDDRLVRSLAEEFAATQIATLRFNFPARGDWQHAPKDAAGLSMRSAIRWMRGRHPGVPLVVGGFSLGALCAMGVALDDEPVDRLVLLGYPLHLPGEPEARPIDDYSALRCPALFISGEYDAVADPGLLEEIARQHASLTVVRIPGADHQLEDAIDLLADVASGFARSRQATVVDADQSIRPSRRARRSQAHLVSDLGEARYARLAAGRRPQSMA